MKIKPIYIFFLILGLLSVSLVMAAEIDGDLQLHKGHKDPTYSEISNPNHHKISHNQSTWKQFNHWYSYRIPITD